MIAVLMYHDVRPTPIAGLERWTVTEERLREHLEAFIAAGIAPVRTDEIVRDGASDERERFCVTFDDAFASFADAAHVVLRDLSVPATVFVPTGYVGATATWLDGPAARLPLLTWSDIRALRSDGVVFGSHSRSHVPLDHVSPSRLDDELHGSRRKLTEELGVPSSAVAYPFGEHSRAVRAAARRAGFRLGFAISEVPHLASSDDLAIPRITATNDIGGGDLVGIARTRSRGRARGYRLAKNTAYRALRQVRVRRGALANRDDASVT